MQNINENNVNQIFSLFNLLLQIWFFSLQEIYLRFYSIFIFIETLKLELKPDHFIILNTHLRWIRLLFNCNSLSPFESEPLILKLDSP